MTELKEIIEEWATKYKPMLHTPGETGKNKRFFLFVKTDIRSWEMNCCRGLCNLFAIALRKPSFDHRHTDS